MMRKAGVCLFAFFSSAFFATTAHAMSIRAIPLAEITEQTDLWVRGNVLSVKSKPLKEDERYRFGHQGTVEVTVVIEITSATRILDTPAITVHWASSDEFLQRVTKGEECIAALSRQDDGTYKSLWALGVYGWFQTEPETGRIPYVWEIGRNVSPGLLWDLVSALEMGQYSLKGPSALLIDAWQRRLSDGQRQDFIASMLFFDAFPGAPLSPAELIAAFERQYAINGSLPRSEERSIQRAMPVLFSLFQRVGDESSLKWLIAIFVQDFSARESVFDDREIAKGLVQTIMAKGGAQRIDLVHSLIGKEFVWATERGNVQARRTPIRADYDVLEAIAAFPGDDVDGMLLDMLHHPGKYQIRDSLSLASVWNGLANRGNPEIETYLNEFLANPGTFDIGVRHYGSVDNAIVYAREALQAYARNLPRNQRLQQLQRQYQQGDLGALAQLLREVKPGDTTMIPALASVPVDDLLDEQHALGNTFSIVVADRLPDPAFLSQLRALSERAERSGRIQIALVLAALHACGDKELARANAVALLHEPAPDRDWRAVYDKINEKTGLVAFLGTIGDPALVGEIDPYTRPDVLDDCRTKLTSAAIGESKEPHDFAVRTLCKSAVIALARTGGDEAVARLHAIYETGDIAARIAAAMGLYALGDDTGKELVDLFVNHQELTNTEIAARWRIDLFGDFHHAAKYLENPRTDAVLLERLQRGFGDSDRDLTGYTKFLDAHAATLLPIFVENLSNDNSGLRRDALYLVSHYLGGDLNYDPGKSPQQQADVVDQIRERVNAYLAKLKERDGTA